MILVEQLSTRSFSLLSYLLCDRDSGECIIVDPPLDIARRINPGEVNIKAVINTHIHPDHTLGNRSLSAWLPILAHRDEDRWFLKGYNTFFTMLLSRHVQPRISFSLDEGTRIALGGTTIEVLHTPGHSPGSICLSWEGNLVSGDTVFAEGIGRTDIPGGSMEKLKESMKRIMHMKDDTVIWPGHSYGGKTRSTVRDVTPFLSWALENL